MQKFSQDAVAGGERAHTATITSSTKNYAYKLGLGPTGELF